MVQEIKEKINSIRPNQWILLFIIAIGAVLRLYNFGNLPYAHDELSALMRTNYTNFSDLINLGVKPDGHPAGIQVFIFYWVQLFGTTEWVVKLPFVLVSIASIYLAFLIGKKLRNETVGLLIAAMIATSQYMIIHGTTARPYGSGVFFTLLFFNALLNLAKQDGFIYWKNWFLFILAGTLASYNHHFSLLATALIGLFGMFFIPRKSILKYLLACLVIVLFYLPHLGITLLQLSYGGVGGADGWLGKPDEYFLQEYFFYLFHYSSLTIGLIVAIVLYGIFKNDFNPSYFKTLLISTVLFLLPIAIGYYYSIYFNPLLQFSILIFTHFFLYLAIFGHLKNLTSKMNSILIVGVVIMNICTLVFTRKNFEINYQSIFVEVTNDLENYRKNNDSLPGIISSRWDFTDYYAQRTGIKTHFKKYSDFESRLQFLAYLDSLSKNHNEVYLGNTSIPHSVIPDIMRFYPNINSQNNYVIGNTYLLSKYPSKKSTTFTNIRYSSKDFTWIEIRGEKLNRNSEGYYEMDSTIEYGPSLTVPLRDLVKHPSDYVDVIVKVKPDKYEKEIIVVCELLIDNEIVQWEGGASDVQKIDGLCSEINTTLKLAKHRNLEKGQLRVYIWNPNHAMIQFEDIEIRIRKGNPYLYGLVDQIFK